MKKLRLILGDQLNQKHSWFDKPDNDVSYLMAEMRQETDYVKHHIQKVVGFFLAMRNFHEELSEKGHRFIYLKIGDDDNPQSLEKIIQKFVDETDADQFEYQLPDEYRLDEQLKTICKGLSIETKAVDSEHFYTTRYELKNFFSNKNQYLMESFYRMMRKKHDIMMVNDQPDGGKWNFDHSNRKKWTGKPEIPHERGFRKDVSAVVREIENKGIETMGKIDPKSFNWPTSRADSLSVLNYFCKNLLVHFGDYQDALHSEKKFLFHSRLSFAMNSKMLSPKEVVDKVLDYYYEH
uniref:cryptochrome/photolyase family protein n=1 Tax=Pricia sp. TaxID=2268138 RepID=UPI0035944EF6